MVRAGAARSLVSKKRRIRDDFQRFWSNRRVAISTNIPLPSLDVLDRVQHLHELERFVPARFSAALEADLGPGDQTLATLAAQLDVLHQMLLRIDSFISKAMAIHLTHLLSTEPVSPQLRTLLSTTVTGYAGKMKLLRERFARAMSPGLLDAVVQAAESVLDTRQSLREGIFALAQKLAEAQAPWVDQASRDKSLKDAELMKMRLARADLAELRRQPARIEQAPFDARLKKLPPPEEEIEVETNENTTNSRFAQLEID